MRKILAVLVVVFGLVAAVSAEPVYVGKKIGGSDWNTTFVSYDTDFDWSTVENVEEGILLDVPSLQKDFDIQCEVGVTYTFRTSMDFTDLYGGWYTTILMFQKLTEDTDTTKGICRWTSIDVLNY